MIAALFAASTLAASAADVYSSNIVGYTKVDMPANSMTIVGMQFQNVGGSSFDINEVLAGEDLDQYGADWVRFWDPVLRSYTTAFYFGAAADGGVYTDNTYGTLIGPGWGDLEQVVVPYDVAPGEGFWMQTAAAAKLVTAGEVVTNGTVATPANSMTLIVNPYPVEVSLQDLVGTNLDEYGADWVRFWNPTTRTYTTAFFFGAAADGGVYTDNSYGTLIGPGWGDLEQVVVNYTIGVGEGFWVQTSSAASISFPAP